MTERPGLIGRGRELAILEQPLDDVEHSGSGWVSVVGEPGIGKTRLVEELCARAEARGGLALAGGGSELELDLPYGVFADAIDDYLGALDPGRLETVLGVEVGALAGVFPALARHAVAGSESSGQRHRIHRTVRALLGRLADDRSFVLALDDLHWADLASLELILYLTRHPPSGDGLLLVLTWRTSADNRLGAARGR
jgi:predicted ATPase